MTRITERSTLSVGLAGGLLGAMLLGAIAWGRMDARLDAVTVDHQTFVQVLEDLNHRLARMEGQLDGIRGERNGHDARPQGH